MMDGWIPNEITRKSLDYIYLMSIFPWNSGKLAAYSLSVSSSAPSLRIAAEFGE